MYILEKEKSKQITVKLDTNKSKNFIKKLIKDYQLESDNYKIENNIFTLYNKVQYTFTDIRNDLYYKGIPYEEV